MCVTVRLESGRSWVMSLSFRRVKPSTMKFVFPTSLLSVRY